MESKIFWCLVQYIKKIWVRVVLFALLAIITAVIAQVLASSIPSSWTISIGAESVDQILDVLVASMLTVTTFSLAIAVSAFSAAATTATPRATQLLQEDTTTQNVLATFLGAFLFSLIGIIALQGGYYSSSGRLILFIATGLVVITVIVALIRWISHLMTFGRMGDTLDRVEKAAIESINHRMKNPYLGGRPLINVIPDNCSAILSNEVGYIQHIDICALNSCANKHTFKIWLNALPGTFVHKNSILMHVECLDDCENFIKDLQSAFTIKAERNFKQDPRFGLIVLSEIASRALSPSINDAGTAISVIGRIVRVLSSWDEIKTVDVKYDSTYVPPISVDDMIEDAFRPIARDGAGVIEVQIRLQKALMALHEISPAFMGPTNKMLLYVKLRSKEALYKSEYSILENI